MKQLAEELAIFFWQGSNEYRINSSSTVIYPTRDLNFLAYLI
jgi:hypothetical protein